MVNKMTKFKTIVISISNRRFMSTVKRKYPIDPEEAKKLPIFQYTVSKKEYRRIFGWGNIHTGGLGMPYLRRNEKLAEMEFLRFPKRVGFGERYEVKSATCGFGFTVFAVNSDTEVKIYGTGLNTDSQIGYHEVRQNKPLEILYYPKPIPLPLKNPQKTNIKKLSAGRAHLLVLTDEGVFTLGNNAYGQCGRKIIPDENYIMSNYIHHVEQIENKSIVDIECGQDHSFAITEDGSVYACGWGADGQTGLGHFNNTSQFTQVKGDIESEIITNLACRSDFVLALNDKGEVFGWGNTEYGQLTLPTGDQQVCIPKHLKMLDKLGKVKSIACGGSFCLATNEDSQVFSWGYGLLGVGPEVQQSREPVHIPEILFGKNNFQPNSLVQKVICGLYHAMAITSTGDLYTWGRNKSCCLGLGNDKDQYFPLKVALGGLAENAYSGVDHCIAICKPFI